MHILIFSISFTLFVASIILLSIELNKNANERVVAYIYTAITFSFISVLLMAIYVVAMFLENGKYNL